jgi:hypothetical protein
MYHFRQYAVAGGLISYGPSLTEVQTLFEFKSNSAAIIKKSDMALIHKDLFVCFF